MAICNFPRNSPPIGQTSTSCLRKFTIHFRRPNILKQKNNYSYRGEYGFDWLRDEYIYPIERVMIDDLAPIPYNLNTFTPLCKDGDDLKKEYLKDTTPFQPYGQDYYPAWLSIFACNVQGNNAKAGSTMHEKGVYLDLQLDEIDMITNDKTEIYFEPSAQCLQITPQKISISEFLKTARKKRILDNNIGQPEIYFYKLENAVRIICKGDTLKQHEQIKVFAKLGSTKYEVGRLMVYHNDSIGKAKIVVINVITEDVNNNKVYPISHNSFEYLFKYQSFNQAMIRAEVKAGDDFDLVDLKKDPKKQDVDLFLQDIKDSNYMNSQRPVDPADPNGDKIIASIDINRRLCELYEKYGKYSPGGTIGINDGGHYNTYLLFTKLSIDYGETTGSAALEKNKWGNIFVVFESGLTDSSTIVHEAAHTFTLPHIFENDITLNDKPQFYQGYTENYMDYNFRYIDVNDYSKYSINQYNDKMYSFFKWQWDLMRKDKDSIEY